MRRARDRRKRRRHRVFRPRVIKGASAEERLQKRLHERVRTIPGTDTQYFVGGDLHVDGIATRHRQDGDEQDTFLVSTTPFGPADRDYRLSIRQSQFDWVSRTPNAIGPVWTRLEANLFPIDGTTALTVNQLFARWDEHFLVGKTYSTFMDDDALPSTLGYNGPSGVTYVRQWLARGRVPLGAGWAFEAAIEEPQANLDVDGPVLAVNTRADRSDLAARLRYESDRGHLQIAGLSRRITASLVSPLGTATRDVDGTGLSVSGSLSLFADDTLLFQAVSGRGVGRYFNDPLSATGLAPDWLTVAGASSLWLGDEGLRAPESLRQTVYASVNLIHPLTPTLLVGAETLWGKAVREDGTSATNLRLQLSVRYLIF